MKLYGLSLSLLAFAAGSAYAVPEDYLIIFAADSHPYKPTGGHTFATLVRIERDPSDQVRLVEALSISWLPETMKVRGLAMRPEKGRNVPLDETLESFLPKGSICMWGPYRIRPELADTFKSRHAAVESHFQYKAAALTSPLHVCDCARSVEEMVGTGRRRYFGFYGYGAAASSVIVEKFSPWLIDPHTCHPWVETLIGLDSQSLIHRSFGDYTTRRDQFRATIRK